MAPQSRGSTEPTQPFSDLDEFQQRVEKHIAERRADVARVAVAAEPAPGPAVPPTPDALAAATPADLEIDEVTRALRGASLDSLPDARLVLATATSLECDDAKPAVVRLPHNVGTWNVVGVVQRTHDVDFTICIKYYDPPVPDPLRRSRFIAYELLCRIYYNPANDDCVLQNISTLVSFTLESATPRHRTLLEPYGIVTIMPGLWRISAGGDGCREQHLVDFLMLRRNFTDGDILETIIAPLVTPAFNVLALSSAHKAVDVSTSLATTTYAPKPIRTRGTPLLDLVGQDIAIVRTNQPGITASVFVGRHSELLGDIVVKVMKYHGKGPSDLVRWALLWLREKQFLEVLHHENIIPQDARTIIIGLSSALLYLSARDICHNDIKPANIAYSAARGAVLLDFGLASSEKDSSQAGGSPWYVPPEAADTKSPTRGFAGDVWALGVVMLYVLGRIQLPGRSVKEWRLARIRDHASSAYMQKMEWVRSVANARDTLDTRDVVERIVHATLLHKPQARINAAQMVAMLQG
ncbi:hypothetical protein RB595_010715 [Gaeumannomyces hyphopodioides]